MQKAHRLKPVCIRHLAPRLNRRPSISAENALEKVLYYVLHPSYPDRYTLVVVATMLILPRLTGAIPGSLVGLILASLLAAGIQWGIPVIGEIPRTIVLDQHLTWSGIPWNELTSLLSAAVAITALGAIESLLSEICRGRVHEFWIAFDVIRTARLAFVIAEAVNQVVVNRHLGGGYACIHYDLK